MTISHPLEPPSSDTVVGHLVAHLTEDQRAQARTSLQHLLEVEEQRVAQMAADGLPPSAAHDHLEMAETIRRALSKLEAGSYGRCESCQEPMPFERLEAMPYAGTCVTCQQRPRAVFG